MGVEKAKIGIFSLTCCEGCAFAILDCPKEFLELRKKIEIKNFRLMEEDFHVPSEKFDIVFIEGSPLTSQNIEDLKRIRLNSKILIAMGSCAHIGGIYHLKKYQDKEKLHSFVYAGESTLENLDVLPLEQVVGVDYSLPGCPITAREFFSFVYQLLIDKAPNIEQSPICQECQANGYECVLQKGGVCLGPITLGGCGAVCLKSKQGCWGCRGLVEDAEVANLVKKLKENYTDKEIIKYFEIFGIKELINN